MATITVRSIEADDVQGYWAALCAVAAEERWLCTVDPPPIERTRAFVADNIDAGNAHYVAASTDGDQQATIVGWADIVRSRRRYSEHVGSLGMGLLAGFRGQGLGQRLLRAALAHAWDQGLSRVELEVFADNTAAIALYEKLGFSHEGCKRQFRQAPHGMQDILLMAQLRE